jgi:hypothetical protein
MELGEKEKELQGQRGHDAITSEFAAIDCLTDTTFRGVAASRTYLGRHSAVVGFVERELVCGAPSEDRERQNHAQQTTQRKSPFGARRPGVIKCVQGALMLPHKHAIGYVLKGLMPEYVVEAIGG